MSGRLAAMIWTRHTHVPGTHFSLGTTMLVSVLGLNVGVYGVVIMGDLLVVEREDGTLLRAKAIPNGMLGYLLGKVVNISGQIAFAVATTLLTGAFLFTGLAIGSPGSWLTLAWALVLALLPMLPLGAVLVLAPLLLRRIPRRSSASHPPPLRQKPMRTQPLRSH